MSTTTTDQITMKAIVQDRYGSADVLKLRDIDKPITGDDEVLVRVHAAGVHAGDWHLMAGLPYLMRMGFGLRAPKQAVRGTDVAGTVESVGKGVTRFRPGDAVFGIGAGAFAEYTMAREDKLAPMPTNISFDAAATVPTSGSTALQGLRDVGKLRPGQRALIIGAAGGVGSFAVQIAKALGAHVTGVCSTTKVDLVLSIGADDVIDYTREDLAERGQRFDLIFDTAGARSLSQLRGALAPQGTLVIVGAEGGDRWIGGIDRQLRAALLSPFVSQTLGTFISKEKNEDLHSLKAMIESGQVTPVIDRSYPLDEVPDAIRYLHEGHARGKIVIGLDRATA